MTEGYKLMATELHRRQVKRRRAQRLRNIEALRVEADLAYHYGTEEISMLEKLIHKLKADQQQPAHVRDYPDGAAKTLIETLEARLVRRIERKLVGGIQIYGS